MSDSHLFELTEILILNETHKAYTTCDILILSKIYDQDEYSDCIHKSIMWENNITEDPLKHNLMKDQ